MKVTHRMLCHPFTLRYLQGRSKPERVCPANGARCRPEPGNKARVCPPEHGKAGHQVSETTIGYWSSSSRRVAGVGLAEAGKPARTAGKRALLAEIEDLKAATVRLV